MNNELNSKEHFRGVVWPRRESTDANGEPCFKYVVVGMLVTNRPIEGLDPNETIVDGTLQRYVHEMGMAGALERLPKFHAAYPPGDANLVLCSLETLVGKPMKAKKPAKPRKQPT